MKLLKTQNLPILLLPLLLLLNLAVIPTYAQEETVQTLQNIEDQRTTELQEQLALTIPNITDNPNHIITFTDPSEEKEGVQLEIDGQGFKKIKSPYTLPSLGIGEHTLTFRFTDKEETRQTLEKSLVVVPRPPIINVPQTLSTNEITISGSALVASQVEVFLAGGTTHQKATVDVAEDGTWTHTFQGDFPLQVYDVVALTKKNGFASSFSETVVFELANDDSDGTPSVTVQPIHFAFKDLTLDNLRTNLVNNLDLLYLLIGTLLLGAGLTSMYVLARRNKRNKKIEGNFMKFFGNKDPQQTAKEGKGTDTDTKKMTLREKFEKAGLSKDAAKTPKEVGMSKEEFMKEYKDQDPDDNKGTEKEKKKAKGKKGKDVKVSLTSK